MPTILYFLDTLNGPTISFIRDQIQLASHNHEVHVVTWNEKFVCNSQPFITHYVPYRILPDNKLLRALWWRMRKFGFFDPIPDRNFQKIIRDLIHEVNPDVIHIQFATNALLLFTAGRFENYQIIVQVRGYDVTSELQSRPGYRRKLKSILSQPNVHLVTVAQSLVDNLRNNEIYHGNFTILRSLTDTDYFSRSSHKNLASLKNIKKIVQIGSFRRKKGQVFAVKAFSKLQQLENVKFELHFYGEGETKEEALAEASRLGVLNKSVFFHTWATRSEVKQILADAHCAVHFAHTTDNGDTEGVPNFLMEAMSMELPVVATRHSGIPELIDESNGILVEENDLLGAAHALGEIRNWSLVPCSRQKIINSFSKQAHGVQLFSIYDNLANSRML